MKIAQLHVVITRTDPYWEKETEDTKVKGVILEQLGCTAQKEQWEAVAACIQ